eukprot:5114286-Alexandrium_andersonii.AAC.1
MQLVPCGQRARRGPAGPRLAAAARPRDPRHAALPPRSRATRHAPARVPRRPAARLAKARRAAPPPRA